MLLILFLDGSIIEYCELWKYDSDKHIMLALTTTSPPKVIWEEPRCHPLTEHGLARCM